jgi:diaminobutyrate-2-oxoglutarate transaminase
MSIFDELESNVRSYCRSFPGVFEKANGALLYSESGRCFLDFLAGAGTLNYGHNNAFIKHRVLKYLEGDNVLHALDISTTAKRAFLETFRDMVLRPRGLDYKIQFCGPTGTNAVEAALKIARKAKKRTGIISFVGGFHGMSLGALSVSSNRASRAGAGVPLTNVTFAPYPQGYHPSLDTIDYIESLLRDGHSGVEKPAAIIFETVQAEGGINIAPNPWMRRLRDLCDQHDIVLICDDIQVGCFRTGPFFSFERGGIVPDIVVLSKSISGLGLPMSLVLLKPDLDVWEPGEHTGTFRGNQMAFVGAKAAIEYAAENNLEAEVLRKEKFLREHLTNGLVGIGDGIELRGVGMIWGVDLSLAGGSEVARMVSAKCFERDMIIERAGRDDTVIKLLPPLTIEDDLLEKGCRILLQSIADVVKDKSLTRKGALSSNK